MRFSNLPIYQCLLTYKLNKKLVKKWGKLMQKVKLSPKITGISWFLCEYVRYFYIFLALDEMKELYSTIKNAQQFYLRQHTHYLEYMIYPQRHFKRDNFCNNLMMCGKINKLLIKMVVQYRICIHGSWMHKFGEINPVWNVSHTRKSVWWLLCKCQSIKYVSNRQTRWRWSYSSFSSGTRGVLVVPGIET